MKKDAVISACGHYRYLLTRRWGDGPACCFVGLNPSTADAEVDDPTIRKCIGFARQWGFEGLKMVNLFALRATDPSDMKKHSDPVGVSNDGYLLAVALNCKKDEMVACWGTHGNHLDRAKKVLDLIERPLVCLGKTKGGHPKHPLYLPYSTKRQPF